MAKPNNPLRPPPDILQKLATRMLNPLWEQSELLVWHSVKRDGYPPLYDVALKCEASDLLLLTIQEFDYFKGYVDSFICLGSYHRDVRDLTRRKYPVMGWIDDRGNEIKARVTHWAIAPKPRKENSHA